MNICIITGSSGLIGSEAVTFFADKFDKIIGVDNNMRQIFFGANTSPILFCSSKVLSLNWPIKFKPTALTGVCGTNWKIPTAKSLKAGERTPLLDRLN